MSATNQPPEAYRRPAANEAGSWTTYEPPAELRPGNVSAHRRTTYRPTAEQLARDEARLRYLRRNVYIPIVITTVIILVLFGLILALAFGAGTWLGMSAAEAAAFIAGLSALTVILFSIPLIFLMSILPIAWVALRLNRRQQRKQYPESGPMAYRSRVQIVLWQLDSLLDGAEAGTERLTARLRRPLVRLHARAAYVRGWLRGIRE